MKSAYLVLGVSACLLISTQFPGQLLAQGTRTKEDWPPLAEEERKWSTPNAHAVLLYRDEYTDAEKSFSTHFYRIKILSNEGRKYGNVEISYRRGIAEPKDIQARTIQPDGSIVPFQGQVFDKTVVRLRKYRVAIKTLSCPDVRVGSILEYRYRLQWASSSDPVMRWTVDHELYTRKARFSLRPYTTSSWPLNFRARLLPGKQPIQQSGVQVLEVENQPPFQPEDHMPPEREIRPSLEFYYTPVAVEKVEPVKGDIKAMLDDEWTRGAKSLWELTEKFLDKDRILREVVASVTMAEDTPEIRLHKLYEHVQKIRNVSYDPPNSRTELDRLEDNKNVEDVVRRGYGTEEDLTLLFVGLARAAGLQASLVLAPQRDRGFFSPANHRWQDLGELALVRVGTAERFFDPGTLFCPFGTISWEKSSGRGIRLLKGGGLWVETPTLASTENEVRRTLKVSEIEKETIEGELHVAYTGQEALSRRLEMHDLDDLARREALKVQVTKLLPDGSTVEVVKAGPWSEGEPPLEVDYHLRIAGAVARTAKRRIIPLSLLHADLLPAFYRAKRLYPVYIPYHYQNIDEVILHLPANYRVESLPAGRKLDNEFAHFQTTYQSADGEVRLRRQEVMEGLLFLPGAYPSLLSFFDFTRLADEDRTVLHLAGAP